MPISQAHIRPKNFVWRILILSLLALVCLAQNRDQKTPDAAENQVPPARYLRDVWGTDEGLPQSSVTSVLQTRDGYVWVGTLGGLARFDGISFTVFDTANTPPLRSNRIFKLYEDRAGALWIGSERGGLTRYADGRFENYDDYENLRNVTVGAIYEDRAGNLWIGTGKGLIRFAGGEFTTFTERDGLPFNTVSAIVEDGAGALWIGTSLGLARFRDERFETFMTADGLPHNTVYDLRAASSADDGLWIATGNGLARFADGKFTARLVHEEFTDAEIKSLYEDGDGILWVGARRGLFRLNGAAETTAYDLKDDLPDHNITAVTGDREGNLWVGTNAAGLVRLKAANLSVYGVKQGLPANGENIVPITEDWDGSVWMGLNCAGLARLDAGGEKFKIYTDRDGLPHLCVWSLLADAADKSLWIGMWHGGLSRFADGKFTNYNDKNSGLSNDAVLALYRDRRDGALWIGTTDGLNRFAGGEFIVYRKKDGLVSDDVRFITQDRAGALWIGTTGGLSRFADGKFINYTTENGLSNNFVRAVYEDADGAFWLGTYGGGLNRLKDGKFTHYGRREGLFDDVVSRILEDDAGNFWMSGNRGIFRVRRGDLNDFADGRISFVTSISYDASDGMENRETNGGGQPAGWRTRDGRLWFPTIKGAVVVDPQKIKTNAVAPPVVIETARTNKKIVDRPARVELAAGNTDLEIRYAGLSFVAPEKVRFKYRLEGYDDDGDWTEAGTRRAAYYTNIPPGNFRFRVVAANNEGVWNAEGATLDITVVPPFYRTWQFYAAAALALGALIFAVYRFRVARLERAHAAQAAFARQLIESQENERKRIAAELHDGLGQNLLVIKNRALLGLNFADGEGKAAEQLNEITASATQALSEVREISYNLRPYHLDRLGLKDAIEAMIEKIAESSGIDFAFEIADLDGVFSKEAEINFYRVVQECLNNIVKHSQATEARVSIEIVEGNLNLTVADNGRGFSAETNPSNPQYAIRNTQSKGFGLTGIAERVRILGGVYSIQSAPGEGTRVSVRINLPNEMRR
jgi:signal transduction histidine kinase/ligand-binding sensor domain-containing protein